MDNKIKISSIEGKRQFIKDLYAGRKTLQDLKKIKSFNLNLFDRSELRTLLRIKLKYNSVSPLEAKLDPEDIKELESLYLQHEKRNSQIPVNKISQIKSTL